MCTADQPLRAALIQAESALDLSQAMLEALHSTHHATVLDAYNTLAHITSGMHAIEISHSRTREQILLDALLLAQGVAQRVIAATQFDESQLSDWRPVVRHAIDIMRSSK